MRRALRVAVDQQRAGARPRDATHDRCFDPGGTRRADEGRELRCTIERECEALRAGRLLAKIGRGDRFELAFDAGFALLEKAPGQAGGVALLGVGESSDAYHMSSPHPQGLGAKLAMQRALESAGRWPEAKAALGSALAIAPNEPLILNFLGYAKLEHGEDLGTVPPGFTDTMVRAGLLSYQVFYFSEREDVWMPPHAYRREAMVCASTHAREGSMVCSTAT